MCYKTHTLVGLRNLSPEGFQNNRTDVVLASDPGTTFVFLVATTTTFMYSEMRTRRPSGRRTCRIRFLMSRWYGARRASEIRPRQPQAAPAAMRSKALSH